MATNPTNTAAYLYGVSGWQHIGGGGAACAVGPYIYGLTPDRSAVYQWNGKGTSWTRVGGAAQNIYSDAMGAGVYATSPGNKAVFAYQNSPNVWKQIGGAGVQFAACTEVLAGLSSVGGSAYVWSKSTGWQFGGSSIKSIGCNT